MTVELVTAKAEHVTEIARIAYEGFIAVSSHHGFPPDFPNPESAIPVYALLVQRPDYFGLVALVDGKPVGSNFIMKADTVAAIGPLTVDCSFQSQGIGRLLMTALLTHASARGYREIRLLQDSYNMQSLSLYASLGFEVRDTVGLIITAPNTKQDPTIRPILGRDMPVIDRLTRAHYNTSRHQEIINSSQYGFQTYLRTRDGRPTGYLMPGLVGHGVAETEEDSIALISEVARLVPEGFRKFLCPMREAKLFQASLKAGWRVEKLLTYMTLGPYQYPKGIWTPSACY